MEDKIIGVFEFVERNPALQEALQHRLIKSLNVNLIDNDSLVEITATWYATESELKALGMQPKSSDAP